MRTHLIRLISLAMIIGGLFAAIIWAHKTVTIIVNGEERTYKTYLFKVSAILRQTGISFNKYDLVQPALDHWIKDGETITVEYASQIYIAADGKTQLFFSVEPLPGNLLNLADVSLFPGDNLIVDGLPSLPDELLPRRPNHSLQVLRAKEITFDDTKKNLVTYNSAISVGGALWSAGFHLRENDEVKPGMETVLNAPTKISVQPSKELKIRFKGGELTYFTSASTVGSALSQAGISLQGLDYSQPPASAPLPVDGNIQLIRVNESITIETETIPFDTQTQPLSDLELDNTSLVQAGSYGVSLRRVRVRQEDGQEVSRQTENEYIASEPKPRIVGYGTKITPHSVNTSDGSIKFWRALDMYAVSYNPTSAGGTITASGLPLSKGIVAVDTNYIPFGTRLYIPGYGEAVAADRGGGVKGRIIDLGYSDSDYVAWHQWIKVYFLWPPPEQVVWIIP